MGNSFSSLLNRNNNSCFSQNNLYTLDDKQFATETLRSFPLNVFSPLWVDGPACLNSFSGTITQITPIKITYLFREQSQLYPQVDNNLYWYRDNYTNYTPYALSSLISWNPLLDKAVLAVPAGIFLYEGLVSENIKNRKYLGTYTTHHVYIPYPVYKVLAPISASYLESRKTEENYKRFLMNCAPVFEAQKLWYNNYLDLREEYCFTSSDLCTPTYSTLFSSSTFFN